MPAHDNTWAGPNVGTCCEFEQLNHCAWFVSMHQKKLPTVWRIISTMSVPVGGATLGPKKAWPHFSPPLIAVTAIQASGRARTASSRHTSFSRHWLANRPENPYSSQ